MPSEDKEDKSLAPGLYLVATPIGNLEDITLRALRVLRQADKIACEDTRQTQKLLNHFQLATPTISYHLFNETERAQQLVAELQAGARIAIVSDAGTPGIADPGTQLVQAAIAAAPGFGAGHGPLNHAAWLNPRPIEPTPGVARGPADHAPPA